MAAVRSVITSALLADVKRQRLIMNLHNLIGSVASEK